ncbi:MFS transporter [Pseudactinotalea terrae]|uniref:MFS transporter n=1 Tax=Pseudactinotalea terrae TaxID=1743262 RepID=UPI0012E18CC6|nr:MFS transporter [Pseudactinotalea terrae]
MSIATALRRRPAAWKHQPFRRLTAAWVTTNLGDSALYLMAAVWAKDLTGSDAAAGIVFAVLGLSTLLAPVMGHIVDRVSRRRLLIIANLVGAGLVCLLLPLTADRFWLLYIVIFGYGALGTLTGAAQGALLRDMLADDELASGNGLLSTIDQALRLVSPLLGTALYVTAGPLAVVALTATCFAATALLLVFVRQEESQPEPRDGESFLRSALAGFGHIARTPVLAPTTIAIGVAFGATGLLNIAAFPVIEQGLGLPAASLGVMVSVQGIGAVLAGVTAASVIARLGEPRTLAVGLTILAAGGAAFLTTSVLVAGAGMAAVGFGVTWSVVAFVTIRQRLTAPRMQGRTSAASNLAINLPQALLTLVGAAVLAVIDYRLLIAITVLGVAGAAVSAFVVPPIPAPTVTAPAADSEPASP